MNITNKQSILWLDCVGALIVGIVILCACQLISEWDSLPLWIILGVGLANLAYGTYSFWVTTRNPRPMVLLKILALANIMWLAVCIAIVVWNWDNISVFGIFHKFAEGIYVASLGCIEWRWRKSLAE